MPFLYKLFKRFQSFMYTNVNENKSIGIIKVFKNKSFLLCFLSSLRNYVLGISSGIEETGSIKLSLALCLLGAWIIVFLCLCKGVKSSGKVKLKILSSFSMKSFSDLTGRLFHCTFPICGFGDALCAWCYVAWRENGYLLFPHT